MIWVNGFAFTPNRERVLLIEKRKPAWMAGKLNGIGGKVEPGETPIEAMVREMREEAGIEIEAAAWTHFVTMNIAGAGEMYCYAAFTEAVRDASKQEEEPIYLPRVNALHSWSLMRNLPVLIALALDDSELVKPVLLAA